MTFYLKVFPAWFRFRAGRARDSGILAWPPPRVRAVCASQDVAAFRGEFVVRGTVAGQDVSSVRASLIPQLTSADALLAKSASDAHYWPSE